MAHRDTLARISYNQATSLRGQYVPGLGHPSGTDDAAWLPSDGAHQLAHRVRDPNGRAYNRTAFLPERRQMMQAWADYLDRLRVGEEIEATHGTGAFRNPNFARDPGTPTHGPPFPVAGAAPPTVGPVPSSPPGSFAVASTHRLDARRTG